MGWGRMLLAGLLAMVPVAGCANGAGYGASHRMEILERESAFHQQRVFEAWSLPMQAGPGGVEWPSGQGVSAGAAEGAADEGRWQWLEFRSDALMPGDALEQAREEAMARRVRGAGCDAVVLRIDGGTRRLDVTSLVVRAYADRERMPVAPTDTVPHPVERLVDRNPPDHVVLSTHARVDAGPGLLRQLATAGVVEWDLCGTAGRVRPAEQEGIRQVHEWAAARDPG